ncbi:MAG: chain-length determining protein [Desulfobacter postgatei]|uniref:Chain-length determining protein n=1 Tax=Desulfobacter postgatei TaxID=2293 RepID=A0A2G6MTB8_9BACT|nr:MAG: chain-length determining protein [Desulfobacter postgatei]
MEEQILSPRDYLAILNRRKWTLIITFVLIFTAALITAWVLPPVYQSTAIILIEEREIPAEYVMTSQTSYAEQRMQIIKARVLTSTQLLELMRQFNLYTEEQETMTMDEILDDMREKIILTPVNVEIADKRTGRSATATIAFTLSFEDENPDKAQQVADRIVTLFLKEDLKVRTDQASSTQEFLKIEADRVKDELEDVETRLAEFKKANTNFLPEVFQLNMQTLSSLEKDIEQTRENLRALEEKKVTMVEELSNTTRDLEDEMEARGVRDSDEKRLEQLKIELINLKTKYSEYYPDVKKVKQEIAELSASIEARKKQEKKERQDPKNRKPARNPAYISLSSRLAGVKSDIASVKIQIRDLEARAEEYRSRLAASPGVETRYRELATEQTNLAMKYRDLQAKMMEAQVGHALESQQKGERFTLVESATRPEKPYKPNRLAIVLIGFVLGIGAGIGLTALVEFSDDSIRNAGSLERLTGFPVLTTVPSIITRADIVEARRSRIVWTISVILMLVVVICLFHFYVMDLNLFWVKLMRKI